MTQIKEKNQEPGEKCCFLDRAADMAVSNLRPSVIITKDQFPGDDYGYRNDPSL